MERELDDIFGSFEYSLFEHLKAADHLLARISAEASTMNIPYSVSRKYNQAKLLDMIDQIAEQREAANEAVRGWKEVQDDSDSEEDAQGCAERADDR